MTIVQIRPGVRLFSAVSDAELMVIKGTGDYDVRCGGVAMTAVAGSRAPVSIPPSEHASGPLLGKRYVDRDAKVELLCIRPGSGSLSLGGEALAVKAPVELPATD
jgi:hypothetical protein